jgi:putative ABC transport system ATP-binding protein
VPPSDTVADGVPAAGCEHLVRIYRTSRSEVHALRGVDAQFPAGTVTAVMGPSGSGKSTLLRLLALLDRPTGGGVRIAGHEVGGASGRRRRALRRDHVGLVLQRPTHNLFPQLTAAEHLLEAARRRRVAPLDAAAALDALGLRLCAERRPAELAGGEQQRLAVAVAAVGRPTLLLADEPTAELDAASAARVVAQLRRAAGDGSAVVVNTHDPDVADAADRVLRLRHGALTSERTAGRRGLGVIDGAGRVQLPPEVLARFPGNRVAVDVYDDRVELRRPPGEPG